MSHAVLPAACWNLPAVQSVHSDCPVASAYVPGAQSECAIEPVAHEEPAGHGVHPLDACRLVLLEKLPGSHGRGMELPSGQKEPGGQAWASTVDAFGQKEPAGHFPLHSELV